MVHFWDALESFGDSAALIEADRLLSYRDLAGLADDAVGDLGRNRELVMVMAANQSDVIAAIMGIWRQGSVVLLCDPANPELRQVLDTTYQPAFIFENRDGRWGLFRQRDKSPKLHPDLAMVISTSGSSGVAKAVRLSKENLHENAASIAEYLGLDPKERALMALPIHYCYGLSVVNSHLLSGGSLVVGRYDVSRPDFVDTLRESGATSFAAVPYMFEILERKRFRDESLPKLRYVTQAGGRLEPRLVSAYAEWARASKKSFFVMYGATEATSRMSFVPPDLLITNPETIGIPIPRGRIDLIDEAGLPVADGAEGQIRYSGPNVMLGYGETAADLALGRTVDHLLTGDMARRNRQGLLQVTGRISRFSKIFGQRLNLDQVERLVAESGLVAFVVSDDNRLFILHQEEADTGPISSAITERFGLPPDRIVFEKIDTPPLLSSGKVDYGRLLASALQLAKLEDTPTYKTQNGDVEAELVKLFKHHFPASHVDGQASFNALSGDSLSYVQVSLGIEEILGEVPDDWEKMSLLDLSALATAKRSWLSWVDPTIPIRAFAPLLVVLNHAGHDWLRGGAAALFIVVGYNFARFQISEIISGRWQRAALSLLLYILLPYWIVILFMQSIKIGSIAWPYVFLFGNNYYPGERFQPFGTWFVQAAIQSILLVTLPLLIPAVRRFARGSFPQFIAIIVIVGLTSRVLLDPVLAESIFNTSKCQRISCNFWLFSAGMGLAVLTSSVWQTGLALSVCVLGFLTFPGEPSRGIIISICVLCLVGVERVPVPRILLGTISTLAAASLWIYMLHPRGRIIEWSAALPVDIVRVVSGVLFGIIAWKIYTTVLNYLRARRWKAGQKISPST